MKNVSSRDFVLLFFSRECFLSECNSLLSTSARVGERKGGGRADNRRRPLLHFAVLSLSLFERGICSSRDSLLRGESPSKRSQDGGIGAAFCVFRSLQRCPGGAFEATRGGGGEQRSEEHYSPPLLPRERGRSPSKSGQANRREADTTVEKERRRQSQSIGSDERIECNEYSRSCKVEGRHQLEAVSLQNEVIANIQHFIFLTPLITKTNV